MSVYVLFAHGATMTVDILETSLNERGEATDICWRVACDLHRPGCLNNLPLRGPTLAAHGLSPAMVS